jgi:hypothetical protein
VKAELAQRQCVVAGQKEIAHGGQGGRDPELPRRRRREGAPDLGGVHLGANAPQDVDGSGEDQNARRGADPGEPPVRAPRPRRRARLNILIALDEIHATPCESGGRRGRGRSSLHLVARCG